MAKLLGFESKEVRSVVLTIGDAKIPAKLYARNLLPEKLTTFSDAYATSQELGRQEKTLNREIKVLDKRLSELLANDNATAEEAETARLAVEAKERELEGVQGKLQ